MELRKADGSGCRLLSEMEEGNMAATLFASGCSVLRSLRTRAHAEKQHAREPGDLSYVLFERTRPVRKGHKPNSGHARTREVGLCRSTSEPVEQRSASFRGGWGGKGPDQGEHRSITQAPDTERERLVPGIARCATSSISKEAGTVHRFTPPPQRRSSTRELLCPEASSLAGSRWHEVAGV